MAQQVATNSDSSMDQSFEVIKCRSGGGIQVLRSFPITTISSAPMIAPAARIRCSSSYRFMTSFDFPDFAGVEHSGEWGALTQARGVLIVGD